jgi:hypothetical protein
VRSSSLSILSCFLYDELVLLYKFWSHRRTLRQVAAASAVTDAVLREAFGLEQPLPHRAAPPAAREGASELDDAWKLARASLLSMQHYSLAMAFGAVGFAGGSMVWPGLGGTCGSIAGDVLASFLMPGPDMSW